MQHFAVKYFFFILILLGVLGVDAQDILLNSNHDNSLSATKEDTSLNGIVFYHNSKTNYYIEDIFSVQYDVFLTHYYNKTNIPSDNFYLKLNNEGSAVKDIIFHSDDIFNYKRNVNIYAPYIFTDKTLGTFETNGYQKANNIKYFQNKKAYTSLSYSNSLNGNQFFNVNFAKNLYKGLNLQTEFFVNYADGEFSNSQIMNQFFNVTLNYISPSGRYRNNMAFIHSRAYTQDNGGIESDSVFSNHEYSKPGSYPTDLSQGWNKWKTSDYLFSQTYRLEKNNNKIANIFNFGAIVHNISFSRYARLYDDENKTIKDSLGTNVFRNSVFWTNDISPIHNFNFIPLSIGINYDVLNFNDSLQSVTFHIVTPEIKAGIRTRKFSLNADASTHLTSDDYKGDYQINIEPIYYLKNNNTNTSYKHNKYIFANIKINSLQPDYIFKHYRTENLAWDNDVKKSLTKQLSLGIKFNNNFTIKASYFDLNNYYFINSALQVLNGNGKLYQVQIHNDFELNKWRLKGVWTLQKTNNEDVLHIPLITVKQGMAYNFTWMKGRLKSQVGIDASYFSSYNADVYNTLTGMYCHQTTDKIGNYIFADAYLNINIDRFCLFIMLQHPYAGLFNYNYFSSPLYPAEGFTFRYGFTWKLLD